MTRDAPGKQWPAEVRPAQKKAVLLCAAAAWAAFVIAFACPAFDTERGWVCANFSLQTLLEFFAPAAASEAAPEGPLTTRLYIAGFTAANFLMLLSPVFLRLQLKPPRGRAAVAGRALFSVAFVYVCSWPFYCLSNGDFGEVNVGYYLWAASFLLLLASLCLPAFFDQASVRNAASLTVAGLCLPALCGLTGCGHFGSGAKPGQDAFAVPPGFHATYVLNWDMDISGKVPNTRRHVCLFVPLGLSSAELENNMRAAAKQAYQADSHPHALMITAYQRNGDNLEAVGRLQWAPHGDWEQSDEDVSVEEHGTTLGISRTLRSQSKSPAPETADDEKLNADFVKLEEWEKKREANIDRRFSLRIRQEIYEQETSFIWVDKERNRKIEANIAWVCRAYHITRDEADCIFVEGDTLEWPVLF